MKTILPCLLFLLLPGPATRAGVLPADRVVEERTLREWAAEWGKWLFSMPTNNHAQLDFDGAWAGSNQPDGPVFFLGGIEYGGAVRRGFAVPEGKYLLVPVLGLVAENIDIWPPLSPEGVAELAFNIVTNVTELHASVNGVPVPNLPDYLVVSPAFSYDFATADNIRTVDYGRPIFGLLDPCVAAGYWFLLEPLPPGTHTLNFGFSFAPPNTFFYDVTDTITVVAVPLAERVGELMALVGAANLPANRVPPLRASLAAARASFDRENLPAGINQLRAFQHKARAQLAPQDEATAAELIQAAQTIIDRAVQQQTNQP